MTPDRQKEIFSLIQQNRRRVDQCKRHKFEIGIPPYAIGTKAICRNCNGELSLVEIGAYCRGYEAAGGNANDIVEGWK